MVRNVYMYCSSIKKSIPTPQKFLGGGGGVLKAKFLEAMYQNKLSGVS